MNAYTFHAVQHEHDGSCSVTVMKNGERIERYWFETPEWALFFKRTCEALNNTRHSIYTSALCGSRLKFHDGTSFVSANIYYTREQVDAMLQRITSLEHWLEPLRNTVRRFFDALMWGERGRGFSKSIPNKFSRESLP